MKALICTITPRVALWACAAWLVFMVFAVAYLIAVTVRVFRRQKRDRDSIREVLP